VHVTGGPRQIRQVDRRLVSLGAAPGIAAPDINALFTGCARLYSEQFPRSALISHFDKTI
jgi:hypothetical protein